MLKILQARLQQYVNQELPDVQAGFRKGRGTRDQIANIHWIIEKAREFQKNIYFCLIDYAKVFDCVDHNKLWKFFKRWEYQSVVPCLLLTFFLICIQISKKAGQLIWYSHLLQYFLQFIVIHTVKGFGIVNKAKVDVFWNSLAFSIIQWMLAI